ncbi:MAG: hypothetical protein V9E98_01170 [Candidatus Nanopelagicales bacterium]
MAVEAQRGPGFLLDLLDGLDDGTLKQLGLSDDPTQMRDLLALHKSYGAMSRAERRRRLDPAEDRQLRALMREVDSLLGPSSQDFATTVNRLWDEAGASDLSAAAEAGLLTISSDAFNLHTSGDAMAEYVETIQCLLQDPKAHLMFDQQVSALVTALMRETGTGLHPLTQSHAAQAATGAGLIERLPAFPDAPMELILEARDNLAEALGPYRKAVVRLAASLATAPPDPAYEVVLSDLWRNEVQPALSDLQGGLRSSSILRAAATSLASSPDAVAKATVGAGLLFGVTTVADINSWAQLAMTSAPLVVATAAQALKDRSEERRNQEGRELFYLLDVEEALRH